jgi:N6-adenosine-specific RNA methylase IME4
VPARDSRGRERSHRLRSLRHGEAHAGGGEGVSGYSTVVADPPWEYPDGFVTLSRAAGNTFYQRREYNLPYPSMTLDEIAALPVDDLAGRNARLFLWTTNRWLPSAFEVIDAWQFTYKQTLTWGKPNALSGSVAPNSEFLLVASRGSPGVLSRLPNAVIWHSQTKTHSRKPELFLDLVEQVSPGPYLEMFARRNRLGWDTWGNECLPLAGAAPS